VRAPEVAVRLKVTLKELKPPVWRRLLVEDAMTLGDLHAAVQAAMGWTDSHLHLFMAGREEIGDPRQLDDVEDEAHVTVGELVALGWKSLGYIYDTGDDWEHTIRIEGVEPRPWTRLSRLRRRQARLLAGGFGRSLGVRVDAGGGERPGPPRARRPQGTARGLRPGGVLGRGGGGPGPRLVRAEARRGKAQAARLTARHCSARLAPCAPPAGPAARAVPRQFVAYARITSWPSDANHRPCG
jgi:hypothetical protein